MQQVIRIEILDNGMGGHDDLVFTVENLVHGVFDTYYFALDLEGAGAQQRIHVAVAALIRYWLQCINTLQENEQIYLPIDFSDEYTGCLAVWQSPDALHVRYGYSSIPGYTVSPGNPEDYCKTVTDFAQESLHTVCIPKEVFVSSLRRIIQELTVRID